MCELFAMSSDHPATVSFALEAFSRRGGLDGPNKDGWGIACYQDGDVCLTKEPLPASESVYARCIYEHAFFSTTVVSHIRQATQGVPALKNCQPFVRELGGRMHIFAHNGDLEGITGEARLSLGSFRPVGDTDSEYAFCALLARLQALWLDRAGVPALADRLETLAEFAAMLRPLGPANFIYGDSDTLFIHAHRRTQGRNGPIQPPGLHLLCQDCRTGVGLNTDGLCVHSDEAGQAMILVASVPLTEGPWEPLAEGELLAVAGGRIRARQAP